MYESREAYPRRLSGVLEMLLLASNKEVDDAFLMVMACN